MSFVDSDVFFFSTWRLKALQMAGRDRVQIPAEKFTVSASNTPSNVNFFPPSLEERWMKRLEDTNKIVSWILKGSYPVIWRLWEVSKKKKSSQTGVFLLPWVNFHGSVETNTLFSHQEKTWLWRRSPPEGYIWYFSSPHSKNAQSCVEMKIRL